MLKNILPGTFISSSNTKEFLRRLRQFIVYILYVYTLKH